MAVEFKCEGCGADMEMLIPAGGVRLTRRRDARRSLDEVLGPVVDGTTSHERQDRREQQR